MTLALTEVAVRVALVHSFRYGRPLRDGGHPALPTRAPMDWSPGTALEATTVPRSLAPFSSRPTHEARLRRLVCRHQADPRLLGSRKASLLITSGPSALASSLGDTLSMSGAGSADTIEDKQWRNQRRSVARSSLAP